jgi:hypothetical protein
MPTEGEGVSKRNWTLPPATTVMKTASGKWQMGPQTPMEGHQRHSFHVQAEIIREENTTAKVFDVDWNAVLVCILCVKDFGG